jgi:hypothetical protein
MKQINRTKRRIETQIKSEICCKVAWWKHCKMLTIQRALCVFYYSLVIFWRLLSFLCAENLVESIFTNLRRSRKKWIVESLMKIKTSVYLLI